MKIIISTLLITSTCASAAVAPEEAKKISMTATAIKSALATAKGTCPTVVLKLNPGSLNKAQISIAVRRVHKGVNPYIHFGDAAMTAVRWKKKGNRYCVKLQSNGRGHSND